MRETQWMIYTKRADFEKIAARFSVTPVLARIIINRGVPEQEIGKYLNGTLKDLDDPCLLPDAEKAADILKRKIAQRKRIRIIGDYDIDGVCATYILVKALKETGAEVSYDIPDRVKDGYGISESIIRKAYEEGTDTLLTCDNGIAAEKEIRLAKDLGMTVLVTDHHEVFLKEDGTQNLPPADAVTDPKRQDSRYPFPEICGAVVAWKLMRILYEKCRIPEKKWEEFLPFAAIATVGDVMRLQDENRILVKEGLKRISETENIGLKKLIECCGLDAGNLSAYHIGFVIGPCLNAGGRLESAKTALKMFLEEDTVKAEKYACHLKELNEERKEITDRGLSEAEAQVETKYAKDKVLVIYLKDCHESVAGIVAGKLKEEYYRPCIVLTDSSSADNIKGSGRSIANYHMFRALDDVKELLIKYGGHPMAAGLTLNRTNEEKLRRMLNEKADLSDGDLTEKIWIDAALPFSCINKELIRELKLLEPFGQGNEKPVFARKNVRIRSIRVLGKNRNVIKLALVSEEGTAMQGLIFADGDAFIKEAGERDLFDILYYPSVDEYRGQSDLQIVIKGWKFR